MPDAEAAGNTREGPRQSREAALPDLPPLLLTRPPEASERFAAQWRERMGQAARVVISPVVEIRALPVELDLGRYASVIFTSENGVAAVRGAGRGKRAWCVGARTAEAAGAAGFEALAADGDADALVAAIRAAGGPGPMLHLRGREARGGVAARLNAAGIACDEAEVYEQVSRPLGAEARALLAGTAPVLVPLFSPNSAARLSAGLAGVPVAAPLFVAAMSQAVAEAWSGPRPASLEVAGRPGAEAMLAALGALASRLEAGGRAG